MTIAIPLQDQEYYTRREVAEAWDAGNWFRTIDNRLINRESNEHVVIRYNGLRKLYVAQRKVDSRVAVGAI
jgi:hypothetical protein